MMVSDHGFGPCLGRIHVNRILVEAGVARLPGWAGRIEAPRPCRPATGSGSGARSATTRPPRSASFDQSVAAQYPFDWKRTLAFAPHQDTAAMVYVNCAARHGGVKTAAPKMTPRQIDDARTAAAPGARRSHASRDRRPALSPDHRNRRGLPDRPDPRRISRPDRAARRALLGPHQADVGPRLGRARPQPARHAPARRESSPWPARDLPAGRHLQANLIDVTPTILALLGHADPGPHRRQTDRRLRTPRPS